jgi:hypothetical protein
LSESASGVHVTDLAIHAHFSGFNTLRFMGNRHPLVMMKPHRQR